LLFGAVLVLLFYLNWQLTLVIFACLPFIVFWAILTSAHTRRIWDNVQEHIADLGTVLHENLTGIRIVKAFYRREYELEKFTTRARLIYKGSVEANIIYSVNTPAMSFMLVLATALILWLGGRDVITGRLTPGGLSQFVLYLLMLSLPVRMMGYIGNITSRAVSAGERIFQILETEPSVRDNPGARAVSRFSGAVCFEKVSFSYGSGEVVLRDVNFEANPGQVIALIGATGSGKTTIINLILRLYDVSDGRITIDGIDIRDIQLASLRRNLGIVQQDVFLFSASIYDNIAYGRPEAARLEVEAAAGIAQLHDFIIGLPRGYDTWVGERGITLSGGQRQRLAIARALLTDPPIIILDDATSSVDTETEDHIQRALTGVMRGRTTLVIAQRLETIKMADLILVIDNGRLVARGTHEDLIRQEGYYRFIYELQFREQEEVARVRSRRRQTSHQEGQAE
jgi:ABC-type multidrug transport system fused ATPase/permease subunit